jgi:membrane protein YqaA with SNARE-associated domain
MNRDPLEPSELSPGVATAEAWEPPSRPGIHRRLYDWVMAWADSPYGPWALFIIAFAESSFFPIPPDVLLIALGVGQPARAYFFAFVSTAGSVLGGMLGWAIGWLVWEAVQQLFFHYVPGFTPEVFARVQGYYDEYGFLAVMIAGFTPIPYKVFTIASGVFGMSFPLFVLASALSRGARFSIEGALIARFGARMRDVLERNFNLMTMLFVVLLVGGFLILRMAR